MQQNSGRTEKQAVVKVQTRGQVVKITLILLILHMQICDRTWEKGPLRAQYDFSVQAFLVYLTGKNNTNVNFFGAKLVSPILGLHSRQI